MIKVFLREKKLKQGKRGLYLDYYPPIVDRENQKHTRREHLRQTAPTSRQQSAVGYLLYQLRKETASVGSPPKNTQPAGN
jgi:hypothetical protein